MDRKEAIKQYKERKVAQGIFALRSPATGKIWVATSPNLDAARNSYKHQVEFTAHHDAELAAEDRAALRFEVLEVLDDDIEPILVRDTLKARLAHWAAELGARKL